MQGVALRLSAAAPSEGLNPATKAGALDGNLLAVSRAHDLLASSSLDSGASFSLYSLRSLRQQYAAAQAHETPAAQGELNEVSVPARITHLRFCASGALAVALASGHVLVYDDVSALKTGAAVQPSVIEGTGSPVLDLLPSPTSDVLALVRPTGMQTYTLPNTPLATFAAELQPTAAAWSTRGKQLVVGSGVSGELAQFVPESGERKATLSRPASVPQGHGVASVAWLENDLFVATYSALLLADAMPDEFNHDDDAVFALVREKQTGQVKHVKCPDPAPGFAMVERRPRRWLATFKSWYVVLLRSSATAADTV